MQSRALDSWIPELTGPIINPRQRPLSPTEHQLLVRQVAEWRDQGVIEKRQKRQVLNNNLVFVAKKNGDTRVCIDCTPVNKVTSDYDWPLPRLQDIRHKVQGHSWFSRLDLKSAFFRIGIPVEFRHFTAFTCGMDQYQFRRMPFGVKTGPSTFQQFMDTRLERYLSFLVVYIDDILILAHDLSELRRRTQVVSNALRKMGSEINEAKSEYEKQTLIFAGVRIHADGLSPEASQVGRVLATPVPVTKADMQSALGLVSYLRDFIPLVSHFTALLYPTKQGAPMHRTKLSYEWGKLLRHIYSAASSLRHWDEEKEADLYADASGYAVGVLLVQGGRLVALASRKLTQAETRYSATDREHLALVFAAQKFRLFLHRPTNVTRVHSDHAALTTGKRSTEMTPRQTRWHTITSQWMPNVRHVAGKSNPADFVSRWDWEINGGVVKTISSH